MHACDADVMPCLHRIGVDDGPVGRRRRGQADGAKRGRRRQAAGDVGACVRACVRMIDPQCGRRL